MSLQGLRTVLEIKQRVPVPYDVFTTVLKAVKYWAMRRAVYGNNFAFPAGVTLAIMVARTCQVYPTHHPSVLLRFFFIFYTQWFARQNAVKPLFITEQLRPDIKKVHGMWESWDPSRDTAKEELLPVINPAFPCNNTSYNVGRSGLEQFYREVTRAHLLFQGQTVFHDWEVLWESYHIGDEFATFFVVELPPPPAEDKSEVPHVPTPTSTLPCPILPLPPREHASSHPQREKVGDESNGIEDEPASATNAVEDTVTERKGRLNGIASANRAWQTWVLYIESKLKILVYSLESYFTVRTWPKRLHVTPRHPKKGGAAWAIGIKFPKSSPQPTHAQPPVQGAHCSASPSVTTASEVYQTLLQCTDDFQRAVCDGKQPPRHEWTLDPMCYLMSQSDPNLPDELRGRRDPNTRAAPIAAQRPATKRQRSIDTSNTGH